MHTSRKTMTAITLAGALGFFALGAAPAEAWELCAKKDQKTGDFMKGNTQLHKKCTGKWLRVASAETLALLEQMEEEDLELLEKMEMVDNDGDGINETVRFTGVNVQVVSGSGATDGTINGLGNLVVGYDENNWSSTSLKTGAHNLVVGAGHSYESFGGFVAGFENTLRGEFSSVSGGLWSVASGLFSSVSGGSGNEASGNYSSVSGGQMNDATGRFSSVSGGYANDASGMHSSVSGGDGNDAVGDRSSVSGGSMVTCSTLNGVCP